MQNQFSRTEILIGCDAIEKLQNSRVAIFGIGGVGGYAVEALVRSGVGKIDLIDNDKVALTNLNRQIIALNSTMNEFKVDAMKKRVLDINPNVKVETYRTFFLPENSDNFPFSDYDYIVDAIDTVKAKIELAVIADKLNIPIISAMGAGNKLDPTKFVVADIYKTSICPLARVMRQELKKRRVKHLKVVYSKETPIKPKEIKEDGVNKRSIAGSTSFCPSVMGLIMASVVVKDLIKINN